MQEKNKNSNTKLIILFFLLILTVALLATIWEFSFEGIILPYLDISYDASFESAERWRFVITSTSFAFISIIIPWFIIHRLILSLNIQFNELLAVQKETQRLARHDPLTGLINRRVFMEQLTASLLKRENNVAVMLIDLDKFKPINDFYGHSTGDEVLCEIADRLRKLENDSVSVARLGGDEFSILIKNHGGDEALSGIAVAINSALSEPFFCHEGITAVGVSIGIARSPEDTTRADILLKYSDTAMYHAKKMGRGTYRFYESSFGEAEYEREIFERDIFDAIKNKQFVPYFQPIINLHTKKISGFEILARWQHPQRGLLMPAEFIAEVERVGAIMIMTENLLTESVRIHKKWDQSLTLAINVSASMLEDETLPDRLLKIVTDEEFPWSNLEIEITEDALIRNISAARKNLQRMRDIGFSIALDDFGTGYSGLYHLTQLSIDKIKLDRSFISLTAVKDKKIVDAIINIGKSLEMLITVEGVEELSLIESFTRKGCDFAQGYLFGKPVPHEQVYELFNSDAIKRLPYL